MRCNFTGRPSGLVQTPCPCGGRASAALPRHSRLQCNAATPPESSGAGGGGGASSSSRYTPQAQPLKQALPGYVTTTDNQEKQQPLNPSTPSSPAVASLPNTTLGSLERGGWDWWTAYFNAMDDTVRELDGVDEELAAAIDEEDYGKAAALRLHQKRLENADCVATILKDMQTAIEEERYTDAAALRDAGGAGLLGWWAGRAETDDPHGHLIHVSADFGRYVAHAYTGINLAELAGLTDDIGGHGSGNGGGGSSATVSFSTSDLVDESIGPARESLGEDCDPGAPVFEVFIRNDAENPQNFIQQATALHAPASALASPAVLEDLTQLLAREVGGNASVSVERGTGEDGVGFVRINVTGVANDDDDDDDSLENSTSSDDDDNDNDIHEDVGDSLDDLGLIEPQAYGARSGGIEDSDETIHTIDDLMKIFEEQEKAEEEEKAENSTAAAAAAENSSTEASAMNSSTSSSSPANDMVDAWVEIDGRLKKMRLEEVVAGAVGVGGGDGESSNAAFKGISKSNVNDSEDDDSDDDDEDDTSIDIGDTLSEMGLGAVAQRVPASIEWATRDAFTFVVAEDLKLFEDKEGEEEDEVLKAAGTVEIVDLSSEASEVDVEMTEQEEDTPTINEATAAKKSGKKPAFSGRLDEIDSIVRSAMGQAIAEGIGATSSSPAGSLDGVLGLSGRINYTRLPLNDPPTDVFSGMYLGTFGPHGPEVLRVARAQIENEEWVQGTKLTGDPNVPAGKVSFRARIGVQHRLSPSGVYPPEYGVQQRYKGQGRVAREGYSAAKWVDGELLTFSAANPMTRGAELGFVFNIDASRKYLLLFTKVKLDKILPSTGY
jgi:Cyclin D1 binding domain